MLAGSEAGFSVTPYGDWHVRELELMVDLIGMSPMAAIQSATRHNAAALGWAGEIGTLERGARADMLVVDGDPLEKVGILADAEKISLILQDGDEVDRTTPIPERRRMAHERGFSVSAQKLNRVETSKRRPS